MSLILKVIIVTKLEKVAINATSPIEAPPPRLAIFF